jgi:hypothetical protein
MTGRNHTADMIGSGRDRGCLKAAKAHNVRSGQPHIE